jgi:hypothetical protein
MSDSSEQRSRELDARDNRRWLIGVGISVAFGIFGVVMALLSYAHRSSPAAAPGAHTPPSRGAGEPTRDSPRHRR